MVRDPHVDRCRGIGPVRNFAPGAMHGTYDRSGSAGRIAELGVEEGAGLDRSSALPAGLFSIQAATGGSEET
jgi:hypothetical protein